jgi:hypothetical protein
MISRLARASRGHADGTCEFLHRAGILALSAAPRGHRVGALPT